MEQRVDIERTQPEAWKSLIQLALILNKSSLSPILKHLIMVRTSQINILRFLYKYAYPRSA